MYFYLIREQNKKCNIIFPIKSFNFKGYLNSIVVIIFNIDFWLIGGGGGLELQKSNINQLFLETDFYEENIVGSLNPKKTNQSLLNRSCDK